MQRILITGASGFVGQILSQHLKQAGHWVIGLLGASARVPEYVDEFRHCDICDGSALEQTIRETAPTHVVHLASITHVPTSFEQPRLTWMTNVMGSVNLLQALRQHAPQAFVLFASSSEVYGASFKQGIALDEHAACQPMNPYAASKLAAEAAFQEYFRQGQPGVIARPFNHIGAGQSPDFVTASFARQIALIEAGQQPPELKVGNLQASRDFLDVQDVCGAYLQLLQLAERPGDSARLYNICSGQPRKIREVLDRLVAMSTMPINVSLDPERLRPSDVPTALGDNRLIQRTTGWAPSSELTTTLTQLLAYWRAQ